MKYTVEVAGRSFVVEVEGTTVLVDRRPVEGRLVGTGALRRLVRGLGSASRPLIASRGPEGRWWLLTDGHRLEAVALDPREAAIRAAGRGRAGTHVAATLVAPMPGLVVRVPVKEGDEVTAGQGLVVLEAMKMENELKAAGAGRVARVHVAPGAKVERGAALVTLA